MTKWSEDALQRRLKWDTLAANWADTGPPASPSNDDLQAFADTALEHCKNARSVAVILGSTIGLRRTFTNFAELRGCRVICCDWSPTMYERLSREVPSNPREIFLESDWVEMDIGRRKADIIMGDKAIDNIPIELWAPLIRNLWTQLRSSGRLVLHLGYVTGQFAQPVFQNIVEKWAKKMVLERCDLSTAAAGLWEDCLTGSAFLPGRPHVLSISKFSDQISNMKPTIASGNRHTQRLFKEFIEKFGSSFGNSWTAYTRDDIVTRFQDYFEIEKEILSNDYDASPSQPIVTFRKNRA